MHDYRDYVSADPAVARCQNCLLTRVYCEWVREMDRRTCCGACEHDLPPIGEHIELGTE